VQKIISKSRDGIFRLHDSQVNKYFFLFSFFLISIPAFSQDSLYARFIVDTLASKTLNGRGYSDSADKKAAAIISFQFQKFGLQKFNNSFYQNFETDVNTFPGNMFVKVGHEKLIPGKDFLVDAYSSGIKGKFKVHRFQHDTTDTSLVNFEIQLQEKWSGLKPNEAVAIDKKSFTKDQYEFLLSVFARRDSSSPKIILEFSNEKLTWDASTETFSFTHIIIHAKSELENAKSIKLNIDEKLLKNDTTQNVIGFVKGTTYPDSFLVFTCHYDHLGQMGNGTYFPGANDNASGCAMILNLAKYFSQHPAKYSIAFIAFAGEELGLVGSKYYNENPVFPLGNIKFLTNLDIVGTGDDGIKVVNATTFTREFDTLVSLNKKNNFLKILSPRASATVSDHYYFTQNGVPSFFIYTLGGISAYHDIYDRPQTLPLTKFIPLFYLLVDFVNTF
jgi:aminopeptidase YwaD